MTKLELQLLLVHHIAAIFSLFICLFGLYVDIPISLFQKAKQHHDG